MSIQPIWYLKQQFSCGKTPSQGDFADLIDTMSNESTGCGNRNDWCSTYTTVCANSATTWNYQGTDLKSLSAGWAATQTTVNTTSANWNSVYTTVCANSSYWDSNFCDEMVFLNQIGACPTTMDSIIVDGLSGTGGGGVNLTNVNATFLLQHPNDSSVSFSPKPTRTWASSFGTRIFENVEGKDWGIYQYNSMGGAMYVASGNNLTTAVWVSAVQGNASYLPTVRWSPSNDTISVYGNLYIHGYNISGINAFDNITLASIVSAKTVVNNTSAAWDNSFTTVQRNSAYWDATFCNEVVLLSMVSACSFDSNTIIVSGATGSASGVNGTYLASSPGVSVWSKGTYLILYNQFAIGTWSIMDTSNGNIYFIAVDGFSKNVRAAVWRLGPQGSGPLPTTVWGPGTDTISISGNLNLNGHSISGIGNNSISFESGATISSNTSGDLLFNGTSFRNLTANQDSVFTTVCANSATWAPYTGTYVGSVTATGMYLTLTVNGSALKLPLYK